VESSRLTHKPLTLVTASAGNHGKGLAHAAAEAGIPLIVYVPASAPRIKIDAIERNGAQIVPCRDYDDAEARARSHGGNARFISPYSHPDVIAGAGTVGLEILQDDPAVDTIVAPLGGGGLVSGLSIAAGDAARVFGVEIEASTPFTASLAAGHIVAIEVGDSIADGLVGNLDPGTVTFDLVRRYAAGVAVVTEREIRAAVAGMHREEHEVIEGATATAVAAVLTRRIDLRGRRVAVVLSGRNIDADALSALI
jgi:threonine dehydratase